jgi:hypothetical protein
VFIWFLGCASNQLVSIVNGDKFPVLINPIKLAERNVKETPFGVIVRPSLPGGMLDYTHCIMTKDTHLNLLGDIFDFDENGFISIGDMLIFLGLGLSKYAFYLWVFLLVYSVVDKDNKIKELEHGYDPYNY